MGTLCSVAGVKTSDKNISISRKTMMNEEKNPGSPQIMKTDDDNESEKIKTVDNDDRTEDIDDNEEQDDDTKDNDDGAAGETKKSKKKLTREEIEEKKKKVLERVEGHINTMKDEEWVDEDGRYIESAQKLLSSFYNSYFALKSAPLADRIESRRQLASVVLKTDILTKVCGVVIDIYPKGWATEEKKTDLAVFNPLKNALLYVHNFSDASPEFAEQIAKIPGYLEMIHRILEDSIESHLKQDQPVNRHKVMKWALSTVHNVSMVESNTPHLRDLNFVKVLEPYLESPEKMISLNCLATLAGIIDEKESEMLNRNNESVKFLMTVLRKGLPTSIRRYNGWSCKECAFAVKMLARNDANKKLLVEVGALDLLVKLAEGDIEEQVEAVGAIWALSFDEGNRKVMVENEELGVITTLLNLKNSDSAKIKSAANGALWTLREDLENSEKYHELGAQLSAGRHAGEKETQGKFVKDAQVETGHIMISYQWASQTTLIEVRDKLIAIGLKVWMDIDQMGGSTLQAMADAVENANIVLIAMSQKYKDSPNCRAEAEYAFQRRKKIVPLMLERGYKPDGWLGFILGAKLFFDFSGKYPFETKMNDLLKELARIRGHVQDVQKDAVVQKKPEPNYHQAKVVDEPDTHHPVPITHGPCKLYDDVRKWTAEDIKNWINKNYLPVQKFGHLTAGEIALLIKMGREAPESFYRCLQDTLKITDLLTQSKLVWALEDIGK